MEADGGATRQTRRAVSEARSRGKSTTFENPTTSNPFTALAGQAVQTDDSDENNENDSMEGDVAFQAAPGPPKPKRFIAVRTPKRKTDTIVVASEEEEPSGCPPRRTRKPSAKAKQNEADQDVFGRRRLGDRVGIDEQAVPENIQEQMNEQTGMLRTLLKEWMKQDAHNKKMEAKLAHMEKELEAVKGECQAVKEELHKTKQEMADGIAALMSGNCSPNPSYAEVARTPPTSQPSNVQTLSSFNTTPSTFTNTLYCTIDTSRVEAEVSDKASAGAIRTMVEKSMRNEQDNATWRCRAVTIDPKNPHRVRIACRDEAEHKTVKQAVEANLVQGARILRDDLYPIRVDSVNRTAVLDETGNIRTGAIEALSEENDTQVAKIAWLSNRVVPKAYGSMVVYLTKGSDARRFLQEGFFYAGGESGYTKTFERRDRPNRCYNCQEITSHKAYQCTKTQVCGRCAKEGHHQTECTEVILKCVPCGGPHESFSRNCRKLYPSLHE
ncbi:reverse transcriptase protein [Rutstroemia sp. NJR-2017a BVV2]|nr:reverse transcriptase protein [Rutstroemia sp. NJR-2017a BVV2]